MTNKELLEKISRLETELAEVKEMAEGLKGKTYGGSGAFKPEYGQEYWFIQNADRVHQESWESFNFDKDLYSIGNCFPTEQSARDTVRVLKLIQKARESQGGFVPDWESAVQNKFYLYFKDNGTWTGRNFLVNVTPTFGYWGDKSECDKFAKDNHDELLWYFMEYNR